MQFKTRTRSQQSYDLNLLLRIIKFYRLFSEYCANAKNVVDYALQNYQPLSAEELASIKEEYKSLCALTSAATALLTEDVFTKVDDMRIRKFHALTSNCISSANNMLNFYSAIQTKNQIETYEEFAPSVRTLQTRIELTKGLVMRLRDVELQELKSEFENNES